VSQSWSDNKTDERLRSAPSSTEPPDIGSSSVSQLLGEVVTDLSTLMRQELALAKAELRQEVARAGRGAALGATAAVAGLLLLICLSLTLIWWLDMAWPLPVAAATVAAIWAVICIVAALVARAQLRQVNLKPDRTIESISSIKEDAPWVSNRSS
jgi:uncharacterized membrane protein YqjE